MSDVFTLKESDSILDMKVCLKNEIRNNTPFRGTASSIYKMGSNDIVIAGGYFADPVGFKDIDVFILNSNAVLYGHLTYVGEVDPFNNVWEVRNDKNYMNGNPHILGVTTNKTTKFQYILTDFKDRKELLADFDFVHCTVSYVPAEDKLYITREAYDCIMKKELRNNKKDEPAMWRKDKFTSRGWSYALKEGMVEPTTSWMDDMITRHGNPNAVLAYQNR